MRAMPRVASRAPSASRAAMVLALLLAAGVPGAVEAARRAGGARNPVPEPPAAPPPSPAPTPVSGTLEVLSAGMVGRAVFRVRVRHTLPLPAPVLVNVPFPGVPGGAEQRLQLVRPGVTTAVLFRLDELGVARFRELLRLRVTAAMPEHGLAAEREAVVPLPVVTVLGIDPPAAFLGRPSVYRAPELEEALLRASVAAWGAENAYQPYGLPLPEGEPGGGVEAVHTASVPVLERYPTLFPFRWDANTGELEEQARRLHRYVRDTVRGNTWAERVALVTHSRGANLARLFLSRTAVPPGPHPYCAAASLAGMPATGSPWGHLWRTFAVTRARGFPRGWEDTLPTYPWLLKGGKRTPAYDFPGRRGRARDNRVLQALNALPHPPGVRLEVLAGRGARKDTLVGFSERRPRLRPLLHSVFAGMDQLDPGQYGPVEFGDLIVSTASVRGVALQLLPGTGGEPDVVREGEQAPWLRGVPVRELVFERPFRELGGLHVAFLAQPEVHEHLFAWLASPQ